MYFQTIQKDDWLGVRRNFQKLESNLFGPVAEPTFNGITLSGISDTQILYSNATVLAGDSAFTFNNSTTTLTLGGKWVSGSFGSPVDVTNTRQYGAEFHYFGNNYDVTGIRSRAQLVTTDTTATACGGLFQAANNDNIDAGVLMGFTAEAIGKSTANASTISTMRGGLIGTEWGPLDTVTNLKTLHLRGHSRNAAGAGSFGTGYALYIENEAVGGNGQAYDAGIYFKGTNISGGNYAFTYGIDLTGGIYANGDINLSADPMIRSDGERVIHFNHDQKGCFVGEDTTDGDIGDENCFIGYQAGKNNDATTISIPEATGTKNTYVGARAGQGGSGSNTEGAENTGIGCEALRDNTTGYENTAIGDEALRRNTTGHGNCAMGNDSLELNTTGIFNTAIGADTLYVNVDGSYNIAVGYQCLYSSISDDYNVGIGYQSLYACNGGKNNVTLGYQAAHNLTAGNRNFCVGPDAGYALITGSDNVFFGYQAGYKQTTSSGDLFIGYQAGYNNIGDPTVANNIAIGYQCFYTDNGAYNIGLGNQAGYYNDSTGGGDEGNLNIYIGYHSGYGDAGGNSGKLNTALGAHTLEDNISGSANVAIGRQALQANTTGNFNFGMGDQTLITNTSGYRNVGIGYRALYANNNGRLNVAIGDEAMRYNSSGIYNTAVGSGALFLSTSSRNVGIGINCGKHQTSGENNVYIGSFCAEYNQTGSTNVGVGYYACGKGAGSAQVAVANQTCLGAYSGYRLSNGSSGNVLLGYYAGSRQTTNDNLLIIDNQDRASAAAEITNALMYGIFDATPANQSLRINGEILGSDGAKIGDGGVTNYTKMEADGTLEFNGAATVWDDYVTPLTKATFGGAANDPTLTKLYDDGAGSGGVWALKFNDGDEVLVTVQMPHRWKEGTTIQPHIHFVCDSNVDPSDNFGIEFEWTWADIGEDYPANTTLQTNDIPTNVNTNNMHQFVNITSAGIDGSGHTISSVLMCRIKRVVATGDNYAGGVSILDFDVHYEIDTVGSRQITTK